MKISDDQKFAYTCKDVGKLLFLYAVWPLELSLDEREQTPKHLMKCPECRYAYGKLKEVVPAILENPEILYEYGFTAPEREGSSSRKPTQQEINQARFKVRLERAGLRRRRREIMKRTAKMKRNAKFISAVAACIIAVFGLYLTVHYITGNKNTTSEIVQIITGTPIKIELVTDSGTEIIQPSQLIIAANTIKVKINDNRRMILNSGTELSIAPYNFGCIVKLERGEIFAVVQHDGKPFIVETVHGRAVITGTTFNIKADDKLMELVVTEGTVKFEGQDAYVNVTAEHKSNIAFNAMPTKPKLCDVAVSTAWATGFEELPVFAAKESEIDLGPVFDNGQVDLDQINYNVWVEQKRPWFKRQFPHIFKFKEALAKDGIETDYPELLIKSDDLWRFAFPQQSQTQLVPANYESMLKLAAIYDKDDKWLINNLKIINHNPAIKISTSTALNKWVSSLEETLQSPSEISGELITYSLHASVYLAETKTLAWLAINSDLTALRATKKQNISTQLERQIKAANSCISQIKQLFASSNSSITCYEDKRRKTLQSIIENIEKIRKIKEITH